MTQATGFACPRCRTPLEKGANFCANCGADISGVWGPGGEPLGKTIAVEIDPNVDTLAQLLTTATLGEYDIYGELGRGGMAAVYLGLDLALNRKVAIKTMLPELVTRDGMVPRFKREAQTSAQLSHPHIIQIYTVKETKQLVYFVMKFIEGRSLESVLTEKGPVNLEMAQIILSQVAGALDYAHKRGVVHRDIKPANIMIDEDGWAIVTDFGIAKVQVEAQNLTATGTAIGTPHYMSPEQFHNKAVTGKSDQYSLGIVAYEMLVGKKPFDGNTYAEIITQHLFEPVPDLHSVRPDIPEHVAAVVKRMLSKEPADRFEDLETAMAELGTPHKKEGDAVRTQMISLAKNGPQKKVRMSVPMSPIPATRKSPVPVPQDPTLVERPRRAGKPAPAPKSRVGLFAAAAGLVVLGAAGVFAWNAMKPDAAAPAATPAAAPASQVASQTDSSTPTDSVASPPVAAPVTQAAAPSTAQVTVTNVPAGAVITLDGRRQSGRDFDATPGSHTLRVEASGYESMTQRIEVNAGERLQVAFVRRERPASQPVVQRPAPPRPTPAPVTSSSQGLSTLRVILNPPATLFIDGGTRGQQSRFSDDLVPGTHTLRAEREGFVSKDTVITLSASQTATVRITLTPRQ